jgi:replicative DNA helicase
MQYKRISEGLNNYKLYPVTEELTSIYENEDKDYYESVYLYEDKHFDKWKATKSLAGILDVKTNKIVLDFDSESDLSAGQRDTKLAVERIKAFGVEPQIFFSGGKGFHVQFNLDTHIDRKQFEEVIYGLAGDLETFDPKIKDQQRLIRLPFTKNVKTGLFKTLLSEEELSTLSINEIKEKAKERTTDDFLNFQNLNSKKYPVPKVKKAEAKKPTVETKKTLSVLGKFSAELDLSKKPKWLSPARYALQEGFFIEGERNEAFMILCATYRAQGFPKEITWRLLKGVAELQSQKTGGDEYDPQNLWKQVVEVVYSPTWRGGVYAESEENLLKTTAERFNLVQEENSAKKRITGFNEDLADFEDYAKKFTTNRIMTGIPEIDKSIVLTREMVIGILGAPGSGKSSFAYNICRNLSRSGKKVLFESLDMSKRQMLAKSILSHLDGKHDFLSMLQSIEQNGMDQFQHAIEEAKIDRANIFFNSRASGVEEIEEDIKEFMMQQGQVPDLVVIDYFEKVRGPYGDAQRDAHHIIPRLTDLAKEYNTCIFLLLQPQKSAGDMNEELNSMRKIKGASIIEQDLRLVLTLWRPGANKDDKSLDKFIQASVVKNNLGPLERFKFGWDGKTGNIRSLTREERRELEELIEKNKVEKEESKENGFGF